MSLKFFKNGITLQNSRLRPYHDSTTKSFIRDILDGYFPSELQKDYPNGVPFEVEDHRNEIYVGKGFEFSGQGYRLGKSLPTDENKSGRNSSPETILSNSQLNYHNVSTSVSPLSSPIIRSSKNELESSHHLKNIRSQILASHNHICSNAHLQSHINAEIGINSLKKKKQGATSNFDEETILSTRNSQSRISQISDKHNSIERLSSACCSNRSKNGSNKLHIQKSVPVNFPQRRFHSASPSRRKLTTFSSCTNASHNYSETTVSRTSKPGSALFYYVNEPCRKSGEFRLKIRSLNGCILYLAYVTANDTVGELYTLLNKIMSKGQQKQYKIVMSGYTSKKLENLNWTLQEYGISTDSVLHLVHD